MTNSNDDKLGFKDMVIVGGLTLLAVSLLPLIAILGLAFQFAFVAIAPVALVGTVAYALVTRAEPVIALIRGIEMPSDVLFARGHGWARRAAKRCVVVGADDFAQRMIGPVEQVSLAREGQKLEAGQVLALIERHGRGIPIQAPISGVVTKVNPLLETEPELVNGSPYGRGWLAEIDPDPTSSVFSELKRGGKAARWMRNEVDRLAMLVQGGAPVAAMADGGELVKDVSSTVDDETWRNLVSAFFE